MNLTKYLFFHRCVAVVSAAAMLSATGPVGAGSVAKAPLMDPVNEYHPMYFGTFNTGVKTSDVYTEGNISFVVPIWSSIGMDGTLGGGTVFLSPYVSLGEQGELATSLGLGWRFLFNDQPVGALKSNDRAGFLTEGFYVGANVFVDNLRTQFDNDFSQLGIGAEIGSRYLELRGNYYLPFSSGQKLAERTSSTENFTSQSRSSSTRMEQGATPLGDPFATGNTIQQDAYLTSTAVTSTRTTTTKTTVKTITSLFEEGMEGWDIEAAMLVPGVDQYLDVSLIAGYYSFDNQPFGPQRGGSGNTEGWKLGIEVRPVPALVLTATWYDDEGLTGSDWVAGVGLQIPLGKDWKDAFKSRRRHLAERLAEPVARQNAAIKTSRSVDVDQEVSQTSSTRTAVVRRVVSEGQGRITIKEDIVFVNNGGDVGNGIQTGSDITGDGTAEQPFETIQKGADLAATNHVDNQKTWTVYTQGAGAHGGIGYGESVSIGSSTAFISSATSIVSPIGGSFGTGDRPTVFGGFAGDASLFVAGSSPSTFVGISGYEIQGGYDDDSMSPPHPSVVAQAAGDGIHLRDVDRVEIVDNIIAEAEDDGVQLYHQDVLEALFEDNRIVDTVDENGIEIDTYGSDINFMSFVNNTITGNGDDGVDLDIEGGLNGWFVDNNVSDNGANGINVGVGRDLIANIVGNTVSDNEDDGFYSFVGGDFIGSVVENSASNNGASGLNFEVLGSMTAGVIGNVADSNDRAGIQVLANQFTGSMAFNEVTNSDFTVGMLVYLTGNYTGDFVNNSGLNNYAGSFLLTLGSDGDFIGNLSYNSATGDDVGISLSMDALNLYGNVVGNNMSNNGSTGIGLSLGERFHGDLSDNVVTGNGAGGGQGIVVSAADFKGNVINNDTSDNAFRGLSITIFDGGGMLSGDFEGNVIGNRSNNILSGDGIGIVAQGSFKGDVVSNIANGNRVGGISVLSFDGIEGNFSMNQTLDNSDSVGLVINTGGNGITGNITQNTSTGNGIAGFFLTANVGSNFVGSFSDNIANNNNTQNINGGGGIVVNIDGMWAGDTQNNVSNNNLGVGFRINVSGGFTGTASGNSSNLNDVGFSTGAILGLGAGAVTGPNTATGNTVFDFESPAGSAILTPLP